MEHCIIDDLLSEIGSVQVELEELITTHSGHCEHSNVVEAYQSIKEQIVDLASKMEKVNSSKMQYKYAKHVLDTLVLRFKVYAPTTLGVF